MFSVVAQFIGGVLREGADIEEDGRVAREWVQAHVTALDQGIFVALE